MNQQQLKDCLSYDPEAGLFRWVVKRKGTLRSKFAGSKMANGYIAICIDGRDYTAHRLAWIYVHGVEPSGCIDHINGDKSDNRIANLRDVSQVINMQNVYAAKSNSKTGLRGVSWHAQRKKYTARIKSGARYLSLGLHDTPEAAHAAYMEAKRRLHEGCTK